jgi:hypothetical protein
VKQAKIKILRKGDSVLTVLTVGTGLGIAVRRKSGNVDITTIKLDSDGHPIIGERLIITEGNDAIEVTVGEFSVESF